MLDRISKFADTSPDRLAFVVAGPHGAKESLTFAELGASVNATAVLYSTAGVGPGDVLVVALRNSASYLSLVFGAWRRGVPVVLVSPWLPAEDRDQLLDLVAREVGRPVLADTRPHRRYDTFVPGPAGSLDFVAAPDADRSGGPAVAEDSPYLYVTSGGSTGLPKIVEYRMRFAGGSNTPYDKAGLRIGDHGRTPGSATRLICGNLFHTGNFAPSLHVLLTGSAVITMTEFDPALMCDLLRAHDVYSLGITPLHMANVLTMPDLDRSLFTGLSRVTHGAATCPGWVKRGWIDLVGPERLFEIYYSSELGGATSPVIVNGVEWLRRPGTVGKPEGALILDDEGNRVGPGVVGEVFFREAHGRAHTYVGDRELRTAGSAPGHVSVADLGWLDEDGFLFLADRTSDRMVIAGHEVRPGPVEEVISGHPDVADVAVVGLAGEDGELILHALVQPRPGAVMTVAQVLERCREALSPQEVPAVVRFTTALPRTEEGKMRRSVVRSLAGAEPTT
ncbi:AMP-binding protein [Umezawaea sp. Da 62-37]|uniref:class I adenylate-forming enzyme family protein n=1 Tax=Umezawaea sp. Da 62-37 TaxID=3075927 RepID=UPI0028F733F6|nr:AMP-binding protein [Umezawaea sp. Da 62-37]WNV85798.1 AMP-binding protein [Umezawaea sp. Da 62-37]